MIEGLCSTSKLANQDDQLELRLMDEYLAIESTVGPIYAIIGLQSEANKDSRDKEVATETEPPVDGEPTHKVETVGEDEPREVKVLNPKGWSWTVSNKNSYNLP